MPRISHVVEVSLPRFQEIDFLDIPSVLEKVMEKAGRKVRSQLFFGVCVCVCS